MDYYKESLKLHEKHQGKMATSCKVPLKTKQDLSLAYTPGVAAPCKAIYENSNDVYKYTAKGNTLAVISDGSAVLGLGNIGPKAAIPVMEGKAALFKSFADIDAVSICLETQDVDEIVKTAALISPTFGGINLEDIAAPRCFEIEEKLQKIVDIPVFHDDQHGTAIVVCAAVINSMKIVNKPLESIKVVVSGAGAAGTAISNMLLTVGIKNIIVCDKDGILNSNDNSLNPSMKKLAQDTNPNNLDGSLADAFENADVFVGVSAPGIVSQNMVRLMNKDAAVFAMANPEPEILPEVSKLAGAKIIGTGRSDFPNQINNLLAFPGIFRGALDGHATKITKEMKIAAAYAIANTIPENELNEENIVPSVFNSDVVKNVALAVEKAWKSEN